MQNRKDVIIAIASFLVLMERMLITIHGIVFFLNTDKQKTLAF